LEKEQDVMKKAAAERKLKEAEKAREKEEKKN